MGKRFITASASALLAITFANQAIAIEKLAVRKSNVGTEHQYRCKDGTFISAFVNGNLITVYGGAGLSTTTSQMSVDEAARRACLE